MDAELSFEQHCLKLSSICWWQLRQLWSIRDCLTQEACETLVHAFVTSKLDYCNGVLAGCSKKALRPLQLVQNGAARFVTRTRKYEHITPVLESLHWLKVQERIIFKVALLVHKGLHGSSPSYLSEVLQPLPCGAGVVRRSQSRGDLAVPRSLTVTYGRISFKLYAPKLWNSLPFELRSLESLEPFKKALKTYLFGQYDK